MKSPCNPVMIQRLLAQLVPTCIASDCVGTDPNAQLRLSMAIQGFFGTTPTMEKVTRADALSFLMADSLTRCPRPGLMIGNIAPRKNAHNHHNGIPFSWVRLTDGHVVVSTAQPEAFASFKLLGELPREGVQVVNTREALRAMVEAGFLNDGFVDRIADSQFRSLDFEPLLAAAILLNIKIPTKEVLPLEKIPDFGDAVAYIDHFGNIKLWIPESAVKNARDGQILRIKMKGGPQDIPFYRQLRSVPNNTLALVVGSSGPHDHHFCELVINGQSAAKSLKLRVGDQVKILECKK